MSHYAEITEEEFKEAMPPHVRKNISPELVQQVNTVIKDPESCAVFKENVLGLARVLKEGRFKLDSYLHAVKYVSHKLLGDSQIDAWSKTFPDRYRKLIKAGYSRAEVGAISSRYASSKLVILLLGQTIVPTHILNAPLYQKAINVQADLMINAKSEKVRSDAAANLIATLRPPEVQKLELDVGFKEDSTIKELRESTMELVRQQREMIKSGYASARTIAESKLIEVKQ